MNNSGAARGCAAPQPQDPTMSFLRNVCRRVIVGAAVVAVFVSFVPTAFGAAPVSRTEEDAACQKAMVLLEAISPSKPDLKELATLFQLRGTIRDDDLRQRVDEFAAAGFLAAQRYDLYAKRIRPVLKDPVRLEGAVQIECPACGGEGFRTVRCGRCDGKGQCPVCKGAGKRRVKADMILKGPVTAHQKTTEEYKEVPCTFCKGTGFCTECQGDGSKKKNCLSCGGSGKTWDAAAVNRLAMENYNALVAALKVRVFEASISKSIVTATADGVRTFAPVFRFGENLVAALPARAVTGITGLSLYTSDKRPVPFSALLISSNRDLVLIDLAGSSIVPPLELEQDASQLDTDRPVYAYGTSRDNDMAVRLDGKILAAGPLHLSTTIASQTIVDGAPLVTDGGKLGGVFMFPIAEFNSMGAVSLMQNKGAAMRLDNLLPSDFSRLSTGDLSLRNNALLFARRAIQAAKDLLDYDDEQFSLNSKTVSDTVQRLDRAVAMLKGVPSWDVFMMEATARELSSESEVRARNLEARRAQIAEKAEAAKRAAAEKGAETNAIAAVAAPAQPDKPAPAPRKKVSSSSKADDEDEDKDDEDEGLKLNFDWKKILIIAAIVIVAITVVFILMGVIQDKLRKKKLAEPPKIPDFIREMQEYERKHPEKRK